MISLISFNKCNGVAIKLVVFSENKMRKILENSDFAEPHKMFNETFKLGGYLLFKTSDL